MNDLHRPAFRVTYRMQRQDFVALSHALQQRRLPQILIQVILYPGALLGMLALRSGSWEAFMRSLADLTTGAAPFWIYLLMLVGPALALFHPQFLSFRAARGYRRNAIADRDVTLDFTAHGVEGNTTDFESRIGWNGVKRLIETPTHLFVAVSEREALIVPRRAFADDDSYRALLGFSRARFAASVDGRQAAE
jgi:hypothetical protein